MKIKLKKITVKDVAKGYIDNAEEGVKGYGGKLDIRPKYQREFVYDQKERDAVIDTINHNFPLNAMYWVKNDDGTLEILDGQQRTISFCQYINGDFSIGEKFFHNLTKPEQDKILNYELMIYLCEGDDKEKLDWFKIVNIAGEKLTDQELRNAVYIGPWLSDAKLKFSKSNCAAYLLGGDYIKGSPIRQEFLETALAWINNGEIEDYMAQHQHDTNADELWNYFRDVIEWIERVFYKKRREMKGLPWGEFYNRYKKVHFDPEKIEAQVSALMADLDVQKKAGVYEYILTGDEKCLNLRTFEEPTRRAVYEKQQGVCPYCGEHFDYEQMHADHITPWSKGGKTIPENCQMLCRDCNLKKSNQV